MGGVYRHLFSVHRMTRHDREVHAFCCLQNFHALISDPQPSTPFAPATLHNGV